MNGQFDKFVEQAEEWVCKNYPDAMDDNDEFHAQTMHKLGELIVGECMRMCDVAAIGYESHSHMKEANGCYSAKEYIAEHFGVEQ